MDLVFNSLHFEKENQIVSVRSQFKKNLLLPSNLKLLSQMQISLNNYPKVLGEVHKIIKETEQNIVTNVNREKVVMSWQIGKIIEEHLLKNSRAEYGTEFFKQLESDTTIAKRTLYQMRSFYKSYPTLPKAENDLSWSHYRNLITVKSAEKRKYLEDLTVENDLGADKLQDEITKTNSKKSKPAASKKPSKLSIKRGKLFTYKISEMPGFIDCGFNVFCEIKTTKKLGEIVESVKKSEGFSLKSSSVNVHQRYTYKAYLDRVIDGDTLHVTLDLGFKIRHKEILRLAKINAAEAATPEGKKAFSALQEILKDVPFLILKTNKTDIYGRYIADVFFGESSQKDPQKVADSGVYLNQLLLDRELVVKY